MKKAFIGLLILVLSAWAQYVFSAEPIQLARMNGYVAAGVGAGSGAWVETWSATLDSQFTDSAPRNYREQLNTGVLSQSGTKVRVTFVASSSVDFKIDGASIGQCSAPDYTSAPTRITFSGSNTTTVPAGNTLVSDEIAFNFNKDSTHCLHIYTTDRNCKYNTAVGNSVWYNTPSPESTDDTLVQDVGYPSSAGAFCISKIEVYQE